MDLNVFIILFVSAAFFGFLSKIFKQSILIGFIFAGILLGILDLGFSNQTTEDISKIGIMFLLFLLGLELKINEFLYFAKEYLLIGVLQIILSSVVAFVICSLLNIDLLPAIIISIAISFSSTMIAVKLITDNKKTFSLQGRLSVGILLVQDLAAIILLTILPSVGESFLSELSIIPLKLITLILFFVFITKYVSPRLFSFIADYPENVFIVSIGWMFMIAFLAEKVFGLSVEMGGLLAGISLSLTTQSTEIFSKIRPVKDFFLTIYFVVLGINLSQGFIFSTAFILPVLTLSLYAVFGKNIILAFLLGRFGYKKKVIFETSLTLSQISEFSIIITGLAVSYLGVEGKFTAIITMVALISMAFSTQAYASTEKLYSVLKKYYSFFEKKINNKDSFLKTDGYKDHLLLLGCDRSGGVVSDYLSKKEIDHMVIDFDPKVIERMTALGVRAVLGDVIDVDILEQSGMDKAKMVISTIPGYEEDEIILEYLKKHNPRCTAVLTASSANEAKKLYKMGADYVIVPDLVSGNYIVYLLRHSKFSKKIVTRMGSNQFSLLK